MDELSKKVKRVQPLIRTKQIGLDRESVALENIRSQKREVMTLLKRFEKLYIQEIDVLNKERQSTDRTKLELLERSVDHYKNKWYENLRRMSELESRERSQLNQVLMAKSELDSMQSLQDRYQKQITWNESMREQKQLDESAIRRFAKAHQ